MVSSNDRRTEELLRIEDLVVSFPKENMEIAVLNSINLSVGQGEIVGIVGESGSGKSIACRSIIGLIPKPGRVSSGKIMFKGKNILGINKAEERILRSTQIGMIFQDPTSSLNPVFTIGDELVKTLVNSGTSSKNLAVQKSIELLERVGLQNPSERIFMYPHELSGGQRQRVMIALALACKPALLIADEPTTSLDVTIQLQILDLLLNLRKETGMSILFVSHDMGVISRMCDKVAVMYGGYIVEFATTDSILRFPQHPYTKALISAVPKLTLDTQRVRLSTISGEPPKFSNLPSGCPFGPRCTSRQTSCSDLSMKLELVSGVHFSACPVERSL